MGARSVDLHPEAIAEGREAREWYRSRSPQAEDLFRLALEQALERIRESPETWPNYLYGTRRYLLRIFPHSLVYVTDGNQSVVVAIAHAKRKAGYWRVRIG